MKLTELQEATKNHVMKVFNNNQQRYLIADEVGLGKTIIAGEIIKELAKDKERFIVYYVCGNERVTTQNCRKLREICCGVDVEDVEDIRLSMQWENAELGKYKSGIVIMPLTPATTFTHKNSEFKQEEFENQCKFYKKVPKDYMENLLKKFLNNKGSGVTNKIWDFKSLMGCEGKNIDYDWYKKVDEQYFPTFTDIRELILDTTICCLLKPDLVILDEFQNYSDLLYGGYQLFNTCLDQANHVLMLSATPYEMPTSEVIKMDPFDDGLGLDKVESRKENDEEIEESFFKEKPNDNFEKMAKFIYPEIAKKEGWIVDKDYLYEHVFCRSERSMFYDEDKESEIAYKCSDAGKEKKHIDYSVALFNVYKEAYKEIGGDFPGDPSNAFISYVMECPAPARFATRYMSLKNQKNDFKYYSSICSNNVKAFTRSVNDMDPLDYHNSLSLLREQTCPEEIEKLLWIPPVVFSKNGDEDKDNPFAKRADYTKTLVFGNYRLSTAAPAIMMTEYIQEKQQALIKKNQYHPCKEPLDFNGIVREYFRSEEQDSDSKYSKAKEAFIRLINQYLVKNIELIRAVTNTNEPKEAVRKYSEWGRLNSVLEEYAYILGLDSEAKEKKLIDLTEQFNNMAEYYGAEYIRPEGKKGKKPSRLSPSKVICFENKGEINNQRDLREKCQKECEFFERFTDDNTDQKAHVKRHQQTLQHLFNSPFYPFVICSTSVAQEGLDFHNYCHRIVHWSVAKTPVAYEQREGRIDRYLSHLMRKRIALLCEGKSFKEIIESSIEQTNDLEKEFGKKPLFPYWYVGIKEYEFFNKKKPEERDWPKFIRVICALPNSRESVYYSKLRAALKNYNYYLGPTYQEKTDRGFCPLWRSSNESGKSDEFVELKNRDKDVT